MSSSTGQIQPYPNFPKPQNYTDKLRQNPSNMAPGSNANPQSLVPNLQNLNPNMQSSPNLAHGAGNATNLSLNFQNLSPIPNLQSPGTNPSMGPISDPDFPRTSSASTVAGQYNGNVQVILKIQAGNVKKFFCSSLQVFVKLGHKFDVEK